MKSIVGVYLRHSLVILLCLFLIGIASSATITSNLVTGNWNNPGSWVGGNVPGTGDDVVIVSGAIITMQGDVQITSLTINLGGILTDNGNKTLTITANLTVNGTLAGSNSIVMNGSGAIIDGGGTISNTNTLTLTNTKTINANGLIKGTGNVVLTVPTVTSTTTVTNNGVITIGGSVTNLTNANTIIWTNASGSTLNVGGTILSGGSTILNASAAPNTVNFYSSSNVNVKRPSSGTYHHLTISGAAGAVKSLTSGNYIINGNLTINSTLDANGRSITLLGNWLNTGGTFTNSSLTGVTVTFSGTSQQTLSSATTTGETFYNLTINNNSSGVVADNNISVSNNLTLTDGNLDIGTDTLTLGTSNSVVGSLLPISRTAGNGHIIGKFERWIGSISTPANPILFPVGSPSSYNPLDLTLTSVDATGSLIAEFHSSAPGSSGLSLTKDDNNNSVADDVVIYNSMRDGYWSLVPSNSFNSNGSFSVSISLETFSNTNGNIVIDNNTRLLTRLDSESPWTMEGNHIDWSSGNTISRSNLTTGLSSLPGGVQFCFGDDTNCPTVNTSDIQSSFQSVCNGATGNIYSVTNTPGSTYSWTIDTNYGTITSGAGTNSITVTWGNTGGERAISVVENNGCIDGELITFDVNVHPLTPDVISGKADAPTNSTDLLAYETYSVPSVAGYSYSWQIVAGTTTGTIKSGQNTNSITVQWGVAGTASVKVTATYNDGNGGCTGSSEQTKSVSVYSVIYSNKTTGNWGTNNTWTCNCSPGASDNVVILNGHTVSANTGGSVKNLIINAGGILNINSALTVQGNLSVNGTMGGTSLLTLDGSAGTPIIDGIGTITTTPITISANSTISSTAILTKTGANAFTISSGVTVTNNGSLSLTSVSLTGSASSSTWTNNAGSTLSVGSAILSTGTLNASSDGNTIRYAGTGNANIKATQYHNLIIANSSGTRTAPSALSIKGDFTDNRTGLANFNTSNNSSVVTFNGSTSQLLGTPATNTTFYSIVVGPSSSLISSADTISVTRDFTNNGAFGHNAGTINFSGISTVSGNTTSFHNLIISGILNVPSINVAGNLANNGTFNHNSGTVTFNSTSGHPAISGNTTQFINLDFTGTSLTFPSTEIDISGNINFGSGTFTHIGGGLVKLNGTTDQTLSTKGATFQNLTVDKTAGIVILGTNNNLTISNALNLSSGDLSINGNTLTLNGTFVRTGSYGLIGSAASNLFVGGAGAFGSLYFNSSGGMLHTLNLDRTSGTFDLVGPLTVAAELNLLNGSLSNPSSYLTMGNGATITRTANGSLIGSPPISGSAPNGNNYNLAYSGAGDIATGLEAEGAHIKNVAIGLSGSTLTQNSPLSLYGVLNVNSGTYDPGNEKLLIRSWSDSENGSIGPIQGTFMSGSSKKITVERYMSKKGSFNRYVSSPVTGTTLMDLADKFALVRNLAQYYDEVIPGIKDTKGYKTAALGTTLTSGKGYLVFPTPTFAAKDSIKWDVTGSIELNYNQGSVALPVTYTPSADGNVHDGWNLVGNPYPSAIVWNNAGWSKTGDIDALIYVPDIAGGVFHVYDAADGDGIIAMGQAFWVKLNAASTLTVHESAKSGTNGTFYRKAGHAHVGLTVSLTKDDVTDKSDLRIQPGSSLDYEPNKDYFKLEGEFMAIGIASSEGHNLVRSVVENLIDEDIYLPIKTTAEGYYNISFTQQGNWPDYHELYLVDRETGNVQRISAGAYTFKNSANTSYNKRFVLTQNPERVLSNTDLLISVFPNPSTDKITVHIVSNESTPVTITSMTGVKLIEKIWEGSGEVKTAQFDISNLQAGMYLIKTKVNGKVSVKKLIKL